MFGQQLEMFILVFLSYLHILDTVYVFIVTSLLWNNISNVYGLQRDLYCLQSITALRYDKDIGHILLDTA